MTTKEILAGWNAHIKYCEAKVQSGEKLTKEEEDRYDFITQKLDDYRSDWYGQQTY